MTGKGRLHAFCVYLVGSVASVTAGLLASLCFSSVEAKRLAWLITAVTFSVLFGALWAFIEEVPGTGAGDDQRHREAP